MKKIMFTDKYELTQAVLEGIKTQTRRIITYPKTFRGQYVAGFHVYKRLSDGSISEICMYDENERDFDEGQILPKYKEGEIVAVAQSYKDLGYSETALDRSPKDWRIVRGTLGQSKGWNNKMFVRVDACIEKGHQIRITKVRMQRLQDISEEDCLAEGIYPYYYGDEEEKKRHGIPPDGYSFDGWGFHYPTPREAYAALIDKISGKGTWEKNPWVWVYEFELIK